MINYSIYIACKKPGTKKADYNTVGTMAYGSAQMNEKLSFDQFCKHIADHNSPFSKGTIQGILTDAVHCLREQLRIPHGERYELCRSVHAEMNAIISASRNECIGATLYLAGKDSKTGEYLDTVRPCSMCRRVIINAGIKKVVMRTGKEQYETVNVQEWVFNDDSIQERADDEAFSFELASNMPERP